LAAVLPALANKLGDDACWSAFTVQDPHESHAYDRLQCEDHVVLKHSGTEYAVAAHRFTTPGSRTAMHDHRYPFAVLPFDESGRVGVPLYVMPWEEMQATGAIHEGTLTVCSGIAYAIEHHTKVLHAVHSLAAHLSIVLIDVTRPPARENRLVETACGNARANALRITCATALNRLMRALVVAS
jgi:hypothetical protein